MANGISINLPIGFTGSGLPSLNWLPSQLGSSLAAWFSADKNVTLNGSFVSAWQDRSANAISVVQATSGQQPNYVTSDQNGLPGIYNSVSGSTPMQLSSSAVITPVAFDRSTPFTIAFAMRRGTLSSSVMKLIGHADSLGRGWLIEDGTADMGGANTIALGLFYSGTQNLSARGSTSLTAGSNYIVIVQYDGSGTTAGISVIVNKNTETMTTVLNTPGTGSFQGAGGRLFMFSVSPTAPQVSEDHLFEVVMINRLLNTGESTIIDSYLNSRWAIHA